MNVNYFHVVFTIPNELNVLCLIDPKFMYKVLFDISAETISELHLGEENFEWIVFVNGVLHPELSNVSTKDVELLHFNTAENAAADSAPGPGGAPRG